MPDSRPAVDPFTAITQPFVDFWSGYLSQVDDATRQMLDRFNGSSNPLVWRRQWLDAMAKSIDAFMRSPAFLEAMRHQMEAVVQAKSKIDDVQHEIARNSGVPTARDISGLFERLHGVEDLIISHLSTIETRLEKIESKLRDQNDEDASNQG